MGESVLFCIHPEINIFKMLAHLDDENFSGDRLIFLKNIKSVEASV